MKKFHKYYLLVFTIIVLTILIQTIIHYSLKKQERMGAIINMAGKQRMLSQMLVKNYYECKYLDCDYAEFKLAVSKLYRNNNVLQFGDEKLGYQILSNELIQADFKKLNPHLNFLYDNLIDFRHLQFISTPELNIHADEFLRIMDGIVLQYQRESEAEIKTIMMIEIQLAVFSLIILMFEIFFIVNPIIKKTTTQNQKLKEVSWHQSHAFQSHMKNIKDLQHVLKIERKIENKEELVRCVIDELNDLDKVSKNMINSLEKAEDQTDSLDSVLKKFDNFLVRSKNHLLMVVRFIS